MHKDIFASQLYKILEENFQKFSLAIVLRTLGSLPRYQSPSAMVILTDPSWAFIIDTTSPTLTLLTPTTAWHFD